MSQYDTKIAFTRVCDAGGLSPSQAIKLFAKAVINYGGIPFDIKTKQPNAQTIKAIQELESGEGTTTADANSLFNELGYKKNHDSTLSDYKSGLTLTINR